jgi:hypothetical protein
MAQKGETNLRLQLRSRLNLPRMSADTTTPAPQFEIKRKYCCGSLMEFVKGLLAPGTFVKGPEAADADLRRQRYVVTRSIERARTRTAGVSVPVQAAVQAWVQSLLRPAFYFSQSRSFDSIRSKDALVSRPPANPVNWPLEPITRWHGTTIDRGFLRLAAPTARTALGRPICRAICP